MHNACEKNWYKEALSDALEAVNQFEERVIEQLEANGEVSTDLQNDYPDGDSYHHENHVDKSYSLIDAAHLLTQLSDYREDDSGLWEGIEDPERAIETQAAFTYGNAVMSEFQDLIKELNEAFEEWRAVPRGPKEWRPGAKSSSPQKVKEFLQNFLKEWREKL